MLVLQGLSIGYLTACIRGIRRCVWVTRPFIKPKPSSHNDEFGIYAGRDPITRVLAFMPKSIKGSMPKQE